MGKGSGECRRLDLRSLVTTKECASTGRVRWMDRAKRNDCCVGESV